MIRLGYAISTLQRCGPVNGLHSVISRLDRSEFQISIFTLSPEPEDSRLADFQALGVTVVQANLGRIAGIAGLAPAFRKFILDQRLDILHSHCFRSDVLNALFSRDVKRLTTIHNDPPLDYGYRFGPAKGWIIAQTHMRLIRHLDAVGCVGESIRERLGKAGVRNTLTINNGIDRKIFHPASAAEKQDLRQKLGLPSGKMILVSAGVLTDRKDPLLLIRAFTALARQDIALLMLGDGPLMEECRAAAAGNPDVIFTGHVTGMADYLRASDLYLSASKAEGMPLAVLEAVGCGLPGCLSDIRPHAEAAELVPGFLRLFETGSADAFTCALSAMIGDLPSDSDNRISEIHARNFSSDALSARYQELYRTLSASSQARR